MTAKTLHLNLDRSATHHHHGSHVVMYRTWVIGNVVDKSKQEIIIRIELLAESEQTISDISII